MSSDFLGTLGKTALAAGGILGTVWGADALLQYLFREPDNSDERYLVNTADAHTIALHRYSPDQPKDRYPVLLVHGLNSNHRNLAYSETDGLAQYLRRQGYECWAIDLRGRVEGSSLGGSWGFDEYVREDLPAALDFITDKTGKNAVHWVGHSMGGMLYLALTGAYGESERIRSGVTLGSPVYFRNPPWIRDSGKKYLEIPESVRRWIDRPARGVFNLALKAIPARLLFLLIMEESINYRTMKVLANVIEDGLDPQVGFQFVQWIVDNRWTDRTGEIDYREQLRNVSPPTMVIVGRRDPLCPNCKVAGFNLIGAEEKRCLVGKETGDSEWEYDHISLVFGESANREIFPEIEAWIDRFD